MQKINTDIVIIGGGIAGLWTLNHLNNKGYNAILLENNTLGSLQTLKSQGIIHGGLKYALNGILSKETELISSMPSIWKKCMQGKGPVNLVDTITLSNHQYLWSSGSLATKLSSFFASKLLKSRIEKVKHDEAPQIFQHKLFKGNIYKLNETVLDMRSVVSTLANNYWEKIIKIDSIDKMVINKNENNNEMYSNENNCNVTNNINENNSNNTSNSSNLKSIIVNINNKPVTIHANCFIFCAGNKNHELSKQHKAEDMQLRPLHMVYLKGKNLKKLYAHCIGTSLVPKITISTHYDNFNNVVWYLGGEIAETGVKRNSKEQIQHTKKVLTKLFPWVDFADTEWGSFFIDRAEAKQKSGKKPENATCFRNNNVITAWPTKLALAPILAENIEEHLNELNIAKILHRSPESSSLNTSLNASLNASLNLCKCECKSTSDFNIKSDYSNFPKPKVGSYAWDEI